MTDPGTFREAILALTGLGGTAFAVEQYIRFRPWTHTDSKAKTGTT